MKILRNNLKFWCFYFFFCTRLMSTKTFEKSKITVVGDQIYISLLTQKQQKTYFNFEKKKPDETPNSIRDAQVAELEGLPLDQIVSGYNFLLAVQEFASLLKFWDYPPLQVGKIWCFEIGKYEVYIQNDTHETSLSTKNGNIQFYVNFTRRSGFRRTENGNEISISVSKYLNMNNLKSNDSISDDLSPSDMIDDESEIEVEVVGNRKTISTRTKIVGGSAGGAIGILILLVLLWLLLSDNNST